MLGGLLRNVSRPLLKQCVLSSSHPSDRGGISGQVSALQIRQFKLRVHRWLHCAQFESSGFLRRIIPARCLESRSFRHRPLRLGTERPVFKSSPWSQIRGPLHLSSAHAGKGHRRQERYPYLGIKNGPGTPAHSGKTASALAGAHFLDG